MKEEKTKLLPTLSTLLIPKRQSGLLSQNAVHGRTVQALPAVVSGSRHVLLRQFYRWQLDALVVCDVQCVNGVFDSQRDAEAGPRCERGRIGACR
jgi:hypothetical protein